MDDHAFDIEALSIESSRTYCVPGFTGFPRRHGGVALDLGLNVGAFSLAYASNFDEVIAVDASSRCIEIAVRNLEATGIRNVRVLHRALGARSGEEVALRRVYVGDAYESKDFSTVDIANDDLEGSDYPGRFREVEEVVRSIDWADLVAQLPQDRIAFVKCDIEGAEYDLLIDADLSMVDCLVLEVHYTFLGRERTEVLLAHLALSHRILGVQAATRVRRGVWPPPSILWLVNRRIPLSRATMLSLLASTRRPA